MPQTRECDFCGDDIEPGTGTMFVRTDGTTVHYCSGKCEKNADLGREPRDVEWTAESRDQAARAASARAEAEAEAADEAEPEAAEADDDAETATETGAEPEAESGNGQ